MLSSTFALRTGANDFFRPRPFVPLPKSLNNRKIKYEAEIAQSNYEIENALGLCGWFLLVVDEFRHLSLLRNRLYKMIFWCTVAAFRAKNKSLRKYFHFLFPSTSSFFILVRYWLPCVAAVGSIQRLLALLWQ
jgi:hypothetical protein